MEDDANRSLMDETTKVVQVLMPLSPEERFRLVTAAFAILGDRVPSIAPRKAVPNVNESDIGDGGDLGDLPPRARAWMSQVGISVAELQKVFHLSDGSIEVISAVPGRNKKEQTYNAYILTGIGQLLVTGTAAFSDKVARSLCESAGCYDSANHSASIRDRGNIFAGSKEKGWTLTAPGLQRGADIIREISRPGT